ncbi:MAG: hypothetical protein LBF05_00460, partial [Tannerella sp.]|nr:hypothetical protein [Tannerella sp.]
MAEYFFFISNEAGDLVDGDNNRIVPSLKAFVGYIFAGGKHVKDRSRDNLYPISDLYPDCLEEIETKDIAAGVNQPVWVNYAVPRDATAGDYTTKIVLSGKAGGKKFRLEKEVKAKVYNVVLPEQTLYITNWFWGVNEIAKKGEEVEDFSDRYWELYTKFVHIMRDHGNNVFQVSTSGIKSTVSGDRYTFDFTEFDRGAELVIREGGAKRIECMRPYFPAELRGKAWTKNDTVLNYWSQYYPAFYDHLKSKGWKDMYMEHIWDEVPESGVPEYIRRAEIIKKYMPDIKIIDATSTQKIVGAIDVWVPLPTD